MERNLELNYNMFRMLLGLEADTEINLLEDLDTILNDISSKIIHNEEFNVLNNPNYQMMEVQEKLGEKNIDLQKWAYAPTLIGFYNYKEKIMTSGFDLSPNHAAGFTMSIPIFSGGTKSAQIAKARIELDKTERTKSLLEDQLALQDKQLRFNMINAYENYNTQRESVEVAKEVYNSMMNKYQQGVISSLDLSQANANYLQAENNYVSSVLELLKSKLALDKLYNKL
jgi:outer membrane protein TolC